ncbi:MAG: polysaccharide biosynthesis/export family protein [Bacteroidales bacterium]|nr:polysaccharide biosynthesis/export family protein [Bacteroidales bacterium]
MNRTFLLRGLAFAWVALLFTSCRINHDLVYVKDAPRDEPMEISGEFSKGIQPNDLLSIYVESSSPTATIQFNQETNKIAVSESGVAINPGATVVSGYLVSQDGTIIFPVLGRIEVGGMTQAELSEYLSRRLAEEGHITDAVVTVKLLNFTVSILGDVTEPGIIQVTGERITIFDALSKVRDITIYGQRKNVTIIREENGKRIIGTLDLTSKSVFDSPFYYLHQNDIVYVEPNKKRKRSAEYDTSFLSYFVSGFSILSSLTSILSILVLSRR